MITPDGIDILNAARKILKRVDREAMSQAWLAPTDASAEDARAQSLGRVAEAADNAAVAIFNFLNVAHNYGRISMTEEQLHGRKISEEVEV